jgi:sialidase-1
VNLLFVTIACLGQDFGEFKKQILFTAGNDGYFNYRLPSIVSTKNGVLLAFCGARNGDGGDWAPIDIVMRRSEDAGKTWSAIQSIAFGNGLPCENPTPVVDYVTNEIHLLYHLNFAKCFYIKSTDDGKTWTKPVDITPAIDGFNKIYPWNVLAPGPGHGIQLNNGRLIVPFWLSNGGKSHRPSIVVPVYSDNHGKTWKAGDMAVSDNDTTVIPNEACCVQLADGRVMFNSRNESHNYRRLVNYSPDGVSNWSEPLFADAFFEPICAASLCRYTIQPDEPKNRILFCNPDSRQNPVMVLKDTPRSAFTRSRSNLTMRMSYDEGITWPVTKVIDPGFSAYSDITVTPDGLIHCLYEGKSINEEGKNVYSLILATFNLEWLTDGKDRHFVVNKENCKESEL